MKSMMPPITEYGNLSTVLSNWENQNYSSMDENQIEDLEDFAGVSNPTSATARKLLLLNNQPIAQRPFYFSDEAENETKQPRVFTVEGLTSSQFSIYPNPANNFVTLSYTILEQGSDRRVLLVNSLGEMVKSMDLTTSQDQLVLKLDNLPAGEYLCFITVNGKSIGSKKITLIK